MAVVIVVGYCGVGIVEFKGAKVLIVVAVHVVGVVTTMSILIAAIAIAIGAKE